jgi:hypothetical protein
MLSLLERLYHVRLAWEKRMAASPAILGSGLLALAALLFFAGIVDWPNIPFAIATAALGGFLIVTVLFSPIGLLFL